jgi:sec-independent protein translocase protein TatB
MFEIGFWEIVVIVVITLLVMGPDEIPAMVRNVGSWMGKARRFMSSIKDDFEKEISKAEELKRRMAEESRIAELHKQLDETRRAIPLDYNTRRAAVPAEKTVVSPVADSGDAGKSS